MDGIELRNFPLRINRFPDWLALAVYLRRSPLAPHQIFICSVTYSFQLIHDYCCNKTAAWREESFHYSSPVFLRVSLPCVFSHIHKDEIGVGLFLSVVAPLGASHLFGPSIPVRLRAAGELPPSVSRLGVRAAWNRLSSTSRPASIWCSSPPPPDSPPPLFITAAPATHPNSTFHSGPSPPSELLCSHSRLLSHLDHRRLYIYSISLWLSTKLSNPFPTETHLHTHSLPPAFTFFSKLALTPIFLPFIQQQRGSHPIPAGGNRGVAAQAALMTRRHGKYEPCSLKKQLLYFWSSLVIWLILAKRATVSNIYTQ